MSETRYTKDHEYVRIEGDLVVVGITDHAQSALGDVVFVDLPAIGTKVSKGKETAVVESVKAASDIYAPVTGEVVEINSKLPDSPGTINEDPTGAGWFMKIRFSDAAELDGLMSETQYNDFLKTIG
jgi:glycine cleavage system H protein